MDKLLHGVEIVFTIFVNNADAMHPVIAVRLDDFVNLAQLEGNRVASVIDA
jgi:hypothetical protein